MTVIPIICNAQATTLFPVRRSENGSETGIDHNVRMKFADLTPEEQRLMTSYLNTPMKSHSSQAMKKKIIRNIGSLYSKFMNLALAPKIRMSIAAKLVDYSRIIRGNGITIADLRSTNKDQDIGQMIKTPTVGTSSIDAVRNGPIIITPDELPPEIENILKNLELKEGYSYLKYLKDNTNFILFTPRLDATVTIMTDNDIGTAEELTRTAIVDTYNEDASGHARIWFLATTILTEVSHIEWYYRHNGNPSMLGYDLNEANSINFVNGFLCKLLDSCGTLIDKKEKDDILYVISENSKKLKKLQEIK